MSPKAEALLQRFPVTDLALALSMHGPRRVRFLERFVNSFTTKSFRALREASPLIYAVELPLFPSAEPPRWSDVEKGIRKAAGPLNADANLSAARALRDLIERRQFKSYPHPEQFIHIAPGRTVRIGLTYYLVEDGRVIFQFMQPRADAKIDEKVGQTLMSLVHYAYVFGDFEVATVEMADLSACVPGGEREPRFHRLTKDTLLSRSELNRQIEDIHGILEHLAGR